MKITRKQFNRYEGCRLSGATNMYDLRNVKLLTGLNDEQIIEIMENYSKYKEELEEEKTKN
tara:strand:+ start:113 stop:295 length:183 start_codon:yes stop_codon:yes gene_type:complete